MKKNKIESIDHFLSKEKFFIQESKISGVLKTFPKPKSLKKYYNSPEYLSHKNGKSTFSKIYLLFKKLNFSYKLGLIKSFKKDFDSLFDYGSGNGFFVSKLRQSSVYAVGYDPFLKLKEEGLYSDLGFLKAQNPKKFDVVTMWHSLEHTDSYLRALKEAKAMLSNKGVLIIACPNYKSLDSKHYGPYWAGFDVPRHLWHFSPDGMKTVLSSCGIDLIKTKPMLFDPFYVSMISEKYKKSKIWFIKGLFVGLASSLASLINKNPSSVIYVAKKQK